MHIFCRVVLLVCTATPLFAAQGQLIVGTSPDSLPFTYRDTKQNKIVGFDIDLITMIAKSMQLELVLKPVEWEMALTLLNIGEVDALISSISYTPERAKRFAFSTPYVQDTPIVLVSTVPITGLEDLHNLDVVVREGYITESIINKVAKRSLTKLTSLADCLLFVKHGGAHAFITDYNTCAPFLEKLFATQLYIVPLPAYSQQICVVTRKESHALLERINQILMQMHNDGSLHELHKRWGIVDGVAQIPGHDSFIS